MGSDRDCFSCVDCPRNTLSLSNVLLQAVIQNDGVGIAPEALARASSQGIIVMRPRLAGLSGTLTVSAGRDNKKTQIRAERPLQRTAGTV
jgi:signal transduction histidine kinase